jgi:hypothetical protein
VFAAYGWESAMSDDAILDALLALNLARDAAATAAAAEDMEGKRLIERLHNPLRSG